jgi:hypothetical protein
MGAMEIANLEQIGFVYFLNLFGIFASSSSDRYPGSNNHTRKKQASLM